MKKKELNGSSNFDFNVNVSDEDIEMQLTQEGLKNLNEWAEENDPTSEYLNLISKNKEDIDNKKLFFKNLEQTRVLTKEEEYELATRVAQGDQQAREELINSNLRLVIIVANKYKNLGLEFLDLVQEGCIGLMKAVDKFDVNKGFRFSTYAIWWIRQTIVRATFEQSRTIRIPVNVWEDYLRYKKAKGKLEQKYGRELSIAELSELTGKSINEILNFEKTFENLISIDMPIMTGEGEESDFCIKDFVENNTFESPEESILESEILEIVEQITSGLSPNQLKVFRERLFSENPKSLAEIAAELGVSKEWVRQLECSAMREARVEFLKKKK